MSYWDNISESLGIRLIASLGLQSKRSEPVPLRYWEPPPPAPTPQPNLKSKAPSKYGKKEKKRKKKEYRSRYEIDLDSLVDEEDGGLSSNQHELSSRGCCYGRQSAVVEPEHTEEEAKQTPFVDAPRKRPSVYDRLAKTEDQEDSFEDSHDFEEVEGEESIVTSLDDGSLEIDPITGETRKKRRELTEDEKAAIERRKAKQSKRSRKKVEEKKAEFVEKVVKVFDPLARYNIIFPPYGRLKGLPMSLAFMKSSHAKRGYDIVVQRRTKRLTAMKEVVMAGGVDTVALNSGPDPSLVPKGYVVSGNIPTLDSSFNGEIVLILWEQDMNIDQFRLGEPLLGWFLAKVHSHCHRPPYNFILKYSKELTGARKLDGFVNTILDPAGMNGYGRRWVWLKANKSGIYESGGEVTEEDFAWNMLEGDQEAGPSLSECAETEDGLAPTSQNDSHGSAIAGDESEVIENINNNEIRQISQASQPNGFGSKLGSKENGGDEWNSNSRIE